jgi:hypothetical protein
MSPKSAKGRERLETLGYQVTASAKARLDDLHHELRSRGRQAYYGQIIELLIERAEVDELEPRIPLKRSHRPSGEGGEFV